MSEQQNNALPAQVPAAQKQMQTLSVFSTEDNFLAGQRIAKALSESTMVPAAYQKNLPNCLVALEVSNRVGMSVFAVMQNMNIIEGRPTWAANFLIASVNSSGRFTPLRFEREDRGKKTVDYLNRVWVSDQSKPKGGYYKAEPARMECVDFAFRAIARDKATGESLVGPWVSLELAIQEGWYHRNGSKYKTMPEQMLMYRAASFFTRLYCPEISLGMATPEEAYDTEYTVIETTPLATVPAQPPTGTTVADKVNGAATGRKKPVQPAAATPGAPAPDPALVRRAEENGFVEDADILPDTDKPDGYDL